MSRQIDALRDIHIPTVQYESGTVAPVALWLGGGTEASPIADNGAVDKSWVKLYTSTTAASGDQRCVYWWHEFKGAGSGEILRPFAHASASGVAAGGTVNAIHASLEMAVGGSVSGAGNAIRATIGALAETRTTGGNCAALQLASHIAAGNTNGAMWSFIRVTDDGAVALKKFINFPAIAAAGMVAVHETDAMTHSIRCMTSDGTAIFLMATTTGTNRTEA
jgi:hypothetical protein